MTQGFAAATTAGNLLTLGGWAGKVFPFDEGAADVTIAGATTWSDAAGFKQVGKLTINNNQTLTIAVSPFFIFAKEIAFGNTSSIIDASGPAGTSGPATFVTTKANGATATNGSAVAQGGCGGGILFVVAGTISGAAGQILANGGAGGRNTTNAGANTSRGGQGAMSVRVNDSTGTSQIWGSDNAPATSVIPNLFSLILGRGSTLASVNGASGGGSGYGSPGSTNGLGGSGIGGGGGVDTAATSNGVLPLVTPTIQQLLMLASVGCLGGGGGGAIVHTTGTNNGGGGGGGGAVVCYVDTASATPTLAANGGTGIGTGGNGASGVTYYVVLA